MRSLIVGAALGLGAALLVAAPAHASVYRDNCRDFYDGAGNHETYCVWVQYRNMAGAHGMIVDQVGAYGRGAGWENGNPPAISCDSIVVKNGDTDAVKWSKTSGCDVVSTSNPAGPFYPGGGDGMPLPNADSIQVQYTGYLRLNNLPDPGERTVSVSAHD